MFNIFFCTSEKLLCCKKSVFNKIVDSCQVELKKIELVLNVSKTYLAMKRLNVGIFDQIHFSEHFRAPL